MLQLHTTCLGSFLRQRVLSLFTLLDNHNYQSGLPKQQKNSPDAGVDVTPVAVILVATVPVDAVPVHAAVLRLYCGYLSNKT